MAKLDGVPWSLQPTWRRLIYWGALAVTLVGLAFWVIRSRSKIRANVEALQNRLDPRDPAEYKADGERIEAERQAKINADTELLLRETSAQVIRDFNWRFGKGKKP